MTAREKMIKARAGLLLDAPFFGSLALRLKLTENTEKRIYTDGTVLSYDPELINGYSLSVCKGIYAHEVMHLAMAHHARGKSFDHPTWNKAGDYAINPIVIENRFELPEGVLINDQFKGKNAEDIYSRIYGKKQDDKPGNGGGNQKGNQPGQAQGQGNAPGTGNQPGNGQGAPGTKPGDAPNWGEVQQATDPDQQGKQWKMNVQAAAMAQKSRGTIPAGLKRMIEQILDPVMPYEYLLRDFVERTAKNDYNFSRPNSRYMHTGFIFPSLISDELPEIVINIDTSGSMTPAEIAQTEPEIQSILDTFKTSVKISYSDSKFYPGNIQTFETGDTVKLEPIGGGGTNFKPVFEFWEQEAPTCLIFFTDLDGAFPDHDPGFPVLWIDTDKHSRQRTAPFGEVIRMHPYGE